MTTTIHKDLAPARQEHICEFIQQKGIVRVDEICEELGISPATARRDLEALAGQGRVRRIHGGAASVNQRVDEPVFDDKTSIAAEEKHRIAHAAAELVQPGQTVYLDGGSTLLILAGLLRQRTDITVVTNSLRAAIELSGSGPRLIMVGGELRRHSQTLVGALTRKLLEDTHVDLAFMGTIGFTIEEGLTTTDPGEAFSKELVMKGAHKVVLLAHSGKAGQASFARSGSIGDVDTFITDRNLDPGFAQELKQHGVEVISV